MSINYDYHCVIADQVIPSVDIDLRWFKKN